MTTRRRPLLLRFAAGVGRWMTCIFVVELFRL